MNKSKMTKPQLLKYIGDMESDKIYNLVDAFEFVENKIAPTENKNEIEYAINKMADILTYDVDETRKILRPDLLQCIKLI